MSGDLRPGQLVRSIAGRDKGYWLLVVDQLDEKFVCVVDGDLRSSSRPKRKNIKHLQATSRVDQKLNQVLTGNQGYTDADVKQAISRLLEYEECNP